MVLLWKNPLISLFMWIYAGSIKINPDRIPITYGSRRLTATIIIDALYCLSYKSKAPIIRPIITNIIPILGVRLINVKTVDGMCTQIVSDISIIELSFFCFMTIFSA